MRSRQGVFALAGAGSATSTASTPAASSTPLIGPLTVADLPRTASRSTPVGVRLLLRLRSRRQAARVVTGARHVDASQEPAARVEDRQRARIEGRRDHAPEA